ncbi:MAG TPA: response regulator [Bryobacteraceae bacterium]|jgi:DNA-binding NarL/FixJ family response regulator|nr:response regulator [Bryobacteraceae bacterium]
MSEYSILFIRPEDSPAQNIESAVRAGFDGAVEWTRVEALFDGLRSLQERSFDLIISELFLPDGQGLATVRHLNQHAPRTPVILLCNTKDRETAVTAVRKGAHDFFCYEDLDAANLCRAVSGALHNTGGDTKEHGGADRRTNARFPCRLAVSYQALEHPFLSGVATSETLNISSKGVLFATDEPLQQGQLLQVSVDWPARLENQVPLKLVAEGRIVRNDNGLAAMRIDKYEFRTRRIKTQTTAPNGVPAIGILKAGAEKMKPSSHPQEMAVNVPPRPGTAAGNKTNGSRISRNV